MQQKYCDHGRSTAVSKRTRPMCRARNSCGSGGKARKASILPAMYKSFGFSLGLPIQCRSFLGSRPTSAVIRDNNSSGLPFETGDPVNVFRAEQYEAAAMHA